MRVGDEQAAARGHLTRMHVSPKAHQSRFPGCLLIQALLYRD
jgi:hypothetical protein